MTENAAPLDGFDTSVPSVARIYDYLLDGKDNYASSRRAMARIVVIEPEAADVARQNRAFLGHGVRYLAAERGIRQFLDIGSGLPSAGNVHEAAQSVAPDSRVVYVDHDPIVLAHARALLTGTREGQCGCIDVGLRDTGAILKQAAAVLDFTRPVALLLLAILHFIPDPDDPWGIVSRLTAALPRAVT